MDLINKCIDNYPQTRAHAREIVERLAEMVLQFPASFANRLEMLRQIEADTREKRALKEEGERKDRAIHDKDNEILISRTEAQNLTREGDRKDRVIQQLKEHEIVTHREVRVIEEQRSVEIDQLKQAHSSEVEQLWLQIRDLNTKNQLMKTENEAEITESKTTAAVYLVQIENLVKHHDQVAVQLAEERKVNGKLATELQKSKSEVDELTADIAMKDSNILRRDSELEAKRKALEEKDVRLAEEREINAKLKTELLKSNLEIDELTAGIAVKDSKILRKDSELEAKSKALEEKVATISAMNEHLTKARKYLTTKQLVSNDVKKIWSH